MSDMHNEEVCEKYLRDEPVFTMSMYVSVTDLYKAKSEHYRNRYLDLAHLVEALKAEIRLLQKDCNIVSGEDAERLEEAMREAEGK